ncbi:MAG: ABC transporter substrate-binding protein, partial [Hyphomicrobiaceae bacterium]
MTNLIDASRTVLKRQQIGLWLAVMLIAATIAPQASIAGEAPARYMQRVAKQLVTAARSASHNDFATAVRSHADYRTIGLYSLGTYRRGLPRSDQNSYFSGMINFIARYAANNAPKYPVARAIVTGQTQESKSGVHVDTRVTLTDGTSYDVRWLLVRRGSTWKVRDAQVMGFWMSPFLKDLFENYISENGGNPR